MSELKSELLGLGVSMLKGRHLGQLQVVSEYQKTINGTKLSRMLGDIEEKQRLDAIFLKKVFDHVSRLEKRLENKD